jgi:predicted DNA-binding helix-hairpin-helix protein
LEFGHQEKVETTWKVIVVLVLLVARAVVFPFRLVFPLVTWRAVTNILESRILNKVTIEELQKLGHIELSKVMCFALVCFSSSKSVQPKKQQNSWFDSVL